MSVQKEKIMSGIGHYQAAERLLNEESIDPGTAAIVHALLAVAAATAMGATATRTTGGTSAAWSELVKEEGR